MRTEKKALLFPILVLLMLVLTMPAMAAEDEIVVLYTNDIHSYIDNSTEDENGLTYSKVAALKNSLDDAILVDAGDHIQGTVYGGMDNGATIIQLMNTAGYDLATLGNHEFDYGMDRCMDLIDAADFPYTSCNFHHESNGIVGESVLPPFSMITSHGKNIAFVGITTPESFTSSTPAYFQDESGHYIYGIVGGDTGAELYDAVQAAIDAAEAAGADYIIALGHLGIDLSSVPWTSRELISNTTGLDAFIDGHSHSTLAMETVADESGSPVVLTQTGSYLDAVGKMIISADGTISTQLLTGEELASLTPDAQTLAIETAWIAEIDGKLGEVIGQAQITLDNYDAQGNRLVRRQSTNTGDFAADALYDQFDRMNIPVDVAIVNGGGIRNTAITGDLTYETCKKIHTFGNVACLQTVTGQQLLDALEWGAADLSTDLPVENGGFLHVSGLRYTIDPRIPSTVQQDEKGVWAGGPTGPYRVTDVQIWNRETNSYVPLDLSAKYNLAGYNYTLRNLGDGFAMFADAVNVLDYVAEDYMVLADYIRSFPVNPETGLPSITADSSYADVNGSGRITILTEAQAPSTTQTTLSCVVVSGDSLWKIAQRYYGSGAQWNLIYEANRATVQNPSMIYVGQTLLIPSA